MVTVGGGYGKDAPGPGKYENDATDIRRTTAAKRQAGWSSSFGSSAKFPVEPGLEWSR